MMRDDLHIVLDSIAILGETPLKDDPRCHEIRLSVQHGNIEWRDGDKPLAEMFAMVEASGELPKTSQPPLGEFLDLFTTLVKQGKKVLYIALDGVLSGTIQTGRLAARQVMEDVPTADIRVVDGLTCGPALAGMAMAVLDYNDEGVTMDEIEAYAQDVAQRTETIFTISTLDYLYKGGRIGAVGSLVGNLLGIMPIIHLNKKGEITIADKIRTRKKLLQKMLDLSAQYAPFEALYVAHAESSADAEFLRAGLAQRYPNLPILVAGIGTVLAAHLGPGVIGIFLRRKKA
ncbi:MAG: DegV family protein [Acidaminococcaceae bacterium]